ncbi:MAG: DUF4383 domain-containing protein [Actinomycetia bacterium]|nr:DUF4383 domain-containing protein [Actinomycetes bacterium]
MAIGTRESRVRPLEPIQWVAAITGVLFLIGGILGFVPVVTTNLDQLQWAGHEGNAQLLGLFDVSVLHNVVHLLFGVAGVLMSRSIRSSVAFLIGGGVVYLVLWLYGVVVEKPSNANFIPVNDADNWLHLGLGTMLILAGLVVPRRRSALTVKSRSTGPAR